MKTIIHYTKEFSYICQNVGIMDTTHSVICHVDNLGEHGDAQFTNGNQVRLHHVVTTHATPNQAEPELTNT